jgi:signal transduction histidine kinase
MNAELTKYQRDYQSALRRFCQNPDSPAGGWGIRSLCQGAVQLGFCLQDSLNVHSLALLNLLDEEKGGPARKTLVQRASAFYGLLRKAIEEKAAKGSTTPEKLKRMVDTLLIQKKELAATNKKLQQEIQQRKAGEKLQSANEKTTRQLLAKSLRMEDELRRLSRRLLLVQEEERKKISRELHDVIAQSLAAINIRLAGLQIKNASAVEDLHQRIADARVLIQQIVEIIHRVACDLRPSALDDLGFIPALQSHIRTLRDQNKLRISVRVSAQIEKIGIAQKTAFFRVVQESLSNVRHHAKATHVHVSITNSSKGFLLKVRDNGRGFATGSHDAAFRKTHLGLLGMRERMEMVGGTFQVESRRGKFTAIHAFLPHPPPTDGTHQAL